MKAVRLALCAVCAAMAACTVRDAVGPGVAAPVAGTWQYSSAQVAPSPAQTDGTLTLSVGTDGSISGTAAVVERVAGQADRALAGTISGQSLDTNTVEFSLTLASVTRDHVGVLHADTLSGSWVVSAGAAAGTSGRFTAVRTGS